MYEICIKNMRPKDMEPILKKPRGQGGFQSFIKKLQEQYSAKTQTLLLDEGDIKRMVQYCKDYGQGGFQGRMSFILSRIESIHTQLSNLL